MLYDNKLVTPQQLKQLVIDAIHETHPGQTEMLSLGNLVRFPCIHRSLTAKAQACDECTKQGKNSKPILPKQNLGIWPAFKEPYEKLQWISQAPFRSEELIYFSFSRQILLIPHRTSISRIAIHTPQKYT